MPANGSQTVGAHPSSGEAGLYGIFEVFVDTILVCNTTGLIILVTDSWHNGTTPGPRWPSAFSTGRPGTWGTSS